MAERRRPCTEHRKQLVVLTSPAVSAQMKTGFPFSRASKRASHRELHSNCLKGGLNFRFQALTVGQQGNYSMKIPKELPWLSTGETLGSGGQGEVQLVTRKDEPDGPKYALKSLRNVGSSKALERFRREISAVKKITHPAIVRVFDHSKEGDDFQYYVMEYHEGAKSLDKVISSPSNRFHGNVLLSLDLFEQIISAIGAYEESDPQIVHRDIQPENILVLEDDSIRLIDFGICYIKDEMMITFTDENVGTRNYTSPECEPGTDFPIGVHSDLYSAAKVLWSAITSQRAFAREDPAFKGRWSMKEMFPTKSDTWHLTHIFEKTIRRRPEDRFEGTAEVLERLRDVRYIVQRGFPPLEDIKFRCPSCGSKRVGEFQRGYLVFGNQNPRGIVSLKCHLCGFGFVRDTSLLQQKIEEMQGLD